MEKMKAELSEWGKELSSVHIPRWEDMPELELYMDQVITLVDRYLSPLIRMEKHPLLTSSMVNNYVKLGLIPAPQKKRYNRRHLAFLVAITLLKQVLTIPEIKEGIVFQGKAVGIREAYNLFCDEQEAAITVVTRLAQGEAQEGIFREAIPLEFVAVRAATMSFATKLLSEKMIQLEEQYLSERETQHE